MPVERLTPERRRLLTREALIEAAAEVFAARGFHAASLDEIADAAGFTRGAIYSNFEGKEELLVGVLELYSERQLAAFADTLRSPPGQTWADRAEAVADLWERIVRGDRTLLLLSLELRLYALRNDAFRHRLARLFRRHEQRIVDLITAEVERSGTRAAMDPRDLAVLSWAFSEGLQQMAGIDEENTPRYHDIAEKFFRLIGDAAVGSEADPRGDS